MLSTDDDAAYPPNPIVGAIIQFCNRTIAPVVANIPYPMLVSEVD